MTAEIALLNKEAVALAADSAVTLTLQTGEFKILPAANKIFSLSKYYPVGIMIYGNSLLVDVPWEVIIKEFRRSIGKSSHASLEAYASAFLSYVSTSTKFFTADAQARAYLMEVRSLFEQMVRGFEEALGALAILHKGESKPPPSDADAAALLERGITSVHSTFKAWAPHPNLPPKFASKLRQTYGRQIREVISFAFKDMPLPANLTRKLVEIAIWLADRHPINARSTHSGLVVAGFGTDDVFASLRSYFIGGFLADTFVLVDEHAFDAKDNAVVLPFAQKEMVAAFMEGIDRGFLEAIQNDVGNMLTAFRQHAAEKSGLTGKKLVTFKRILEGGADSLLRRFEMQLAAVRREEFWLPIVSVTAMLPKTELAAMAESLVNLTSFKRRVSAEVETVGGPIDVALISKGDGFVWVKRKHYFTKELNPQFFENYFRED